MNNEFYEEPQNSTPSEISEDIPQALRDTPDAAPKLGLRPSFLAIAGVMGFAVLAAISGLIFYIAAPKNSSTVSEKSVEADSCHVNGMRACSVLLSLPMSAQLPA